MGTTAATLNQNGYARRRQAHAEMIARAGGLEKALQSGSIPLCLDSDLSEAVVLGLLLQNVRTFVGVFGHGTTEVGEVLRIYEEARLVKTYQVRSEIEASHAAAALRWVTGEKAAVVTSIGPGALHAMAASIVAASDGIGIWYLMGDETTQDEGPNMQQIPRNEQNLFVRLFSAMGQTYSLHTPQAVSTALRRGLASVDHPYRAGPFFLLLPMNTQPALMPAFNLDELPRSVAFSLGEARDTASAYAEAAEALLAAQRIVVKTGGGARATGPELLEFLELVDGVAVLSPLVTGLIPFSHPRNMLVGGSKGTICGNYAMEEADLLVAIGSRSVCQSDCSRTGYPNVKHVVNINTDMHDVIHYGKTTSLLGDAALTLRRLNSEIRALLPAGKSACNPSGWLLACQAKRLEWESYKAERYRNPCLFDEVWGKKVLTQPAAIKAASDWARANGVVSFFDAGDVQANGFQIVEDDRLGQTFSETGASYMGFAASALLATALASKPFYGLALCGDGSFTMNPQILIDGVEHGAHGCILVLDNRRMAAISSLQEAQYGAAYATWDTVDVDYIGLARSIRGVEAFDGGCSIESLKHALDSAKAYPGLSFVHVPVYYGPDPLGGLGAFGRWNVGNWVEKTQTLRHTIGL